MTNSHERDSSFNRFWEAASTVNELLLKPSITGEALRDEMVRILTNHPKKETIIKKIFRNLHKAGFFVRSAGVINPSKEELYCCHLTPEAETIIVNNSSYKILNFKLAGAKLFKPLSNMGQDSYDTLRLAVIELQRKTKT